MVKSTLRVRLILESRHILTGFVERIILIILQYLIGNERKAILKRASVMGILVISSGQRMIRLEYGHVVIMTLQMDVARVLRWSINHLSGQMKKLRSTFMISLDDLILISP